MKNQVNINKNSGDISFFDTNGVEVIINQQNTNDIIQKLELLHLEQVKLLQEKIEEYKAFLSGTFVSILLERIEALNSENSSDDKTQNHSGDGDNVIHKTENNFYGTKPVSKSPQSILIDFAAASCILSEYRNYFSELKNSHIKRTETTQLLNWIEKPLIKNEREYKLKLLVGKAGIGKSVIMRDLYHLLNENDIPVLGIKSDKYLKSSVEELEKQLNLKNSIIDEIGVLNNKNRPIVILIDQIDALSQTLSLRRDYLITYKTLIDKLLNSDLNVRVIISVREIDLKIDLYLSEYDNSSNIIKVDLLSEKALNEILESLNVNLKSINKSLFELLRIPNHLNIFCEIYRSDLRLETITTLKNLYDELWGKYFENIPKEAKINTGTCTDLVFEIASDMYEMQLPNLTEKRLWKKYKNEVDYLLSVGFLIEKNHTMQFSHQSLYDYSFVKYFIHTEQDVFEYLHKNKQGLFIRAGFKMIVQSLRDERTNFNKYLQIYEEVLLSDVFRFHLKHLLIVLLGFVDVPTRNEKVFVRKYILSSKEFKILFIDAVQTKGWLSFLIDEKAFNDLILNPTTDGDIDKWIWTLARFLPQESDLILRYISKLPEFENKSKVITHFLYRLRIWNNPIAFNLFETFFDKNLIFSRANLMILESMLDNVNNFDYVTDAYFKQLNLEEINKNYIKGKDLGFDYDDEELLKKLFQIDIDKAFTFSYELLGKLLEISQIERSDNEYFIGDTIFLWMDFEKEKSYDKIAILPKSILNTLKNWAINEEEKFEDFIITNIDNNHIIILKIIILALSVQPEKFVDLIFDFMIKFHQKRGWILRGNLKDTFEILFYNSYQYLSEEQKNIINQIVMSLVADDEKKSFPLNNGKRKIYYSLDKFHYIALIPNGDRTYEMKKIFKEGKRRGYEQNLGRYKGGMGGFYAPLPQIAYEKMSMKQWEKSMLKYDKENRDRTWGSFKGSLTEHARKFGECVKDNTLKYYHFIEKIISDKKVSPFYVLEGFNGLKEAEFDAKKLKKLLESALEILQNEHQQEILRLHHYLTTKKVYSPKVVNLIIQWSKETPDLSRFEETLQLIEEGKVKDHDNLVQIGSSSYVGNAIFKLIYLFQFEEYRNIIFSTLHQVLDNGCHDTIKACMLHELSCLLNLSRTKTVQLFLRITNTDKLALLHHGINVVQYLCREDFELYIPYFQKAMNYPKSQPHIATILSVRWIYNEVDSENLLEQLFKLNDKAKASALSVAAHNLTIEEVNQERCKELYLRFLNEESDEVANGYREAFRELENHPFEVSYPLLQEFVKSNIAKKLGRAFYQYLIKFASFYPKECLKLMQYQESYEVPDMTRHGYYDEEPMQVLIGAYNSLDATDKENEAIITNILDAYDSILKKPRLRKKATEMIEGIEM